MEKIDTKGLRKAAVLRADDLNSPRAVRNLCMAIKILEHQINAHTDVLRALAPESAPPVPVTVPDSPPAAVGMTAEQFYAELDAIERNCANFGSSRTVALAVDLGARWRAATGLPLPTRPKGPTR